ncbi:hypothetical protein JW935_05615 [candidate division KSB1 bacterium]|nr:hypothetical protein [candidate division KSB1 bacterium]
MRRKIPFGWWKSSQNPQYQTTQRDFLSTSYPKRKTAAGYGSRKLIKTK